MKILVVAVVVLVLLFAAGVGLGGRADQGSPASWQGAGWLQAMGAVAGGIEPARLHGSCVAASGLVVGGGGSCVVTAAAEAAGLLHLRLPRGWALRLTQGGPLALHFSPAAGARAVASTQTLHAGAGHDRLTLSVPPEGGTIVFTCLATAPCRTAAN